MNKSNLFETSRIPTNQIGGSSSISYPSLNYPFSGWFSEASCSALESWTIVYSKCWLAALQSIVIPVSRVPQFLWRIKDLRRRSLRHGCRYSSLLVRSTYSPPSASLRLSSLVSSWIINSRI